MQVSAVRTNNESRLGGGVGGESELTASLFRGEFLCTCTLNVVG